jgi:carbon storage regulator
MLILSRRPGESVKIGDEVTVKVLGIRGIQVRLGFEAPQDVAVHREEVFLRLKAETSANAPTNEAGGVLALVPDYLRFYRLA